jgi:hypothetical protein
MSRGEETANHLVLLELFDVAIYLCRLL